MEILYVNEMNVMPSGQILIRNIDGNGILDTYINN
jgi:hypothetical protein